MTVGDWTARIWAEDLKTPIMTTKVISQTVVLTEVARCENCTKGRVVRVVQTMLLNFRKRATNFGQVSFARISVLHIVRSLSHALCDGTTPKL